MATATTNLSLIKPESTDATVIRTIYNTNLDTIDGRFSATYMAVQAAASVAITGGSITGITDLVVADGGTGVSILTDGGVLLGSGAGAITAMAVLSDSEMIVGNGTTDPVAESGSTLRTSIGCASRALDNIASCAINTSLLLGSSDGGALGSATLMWSDLFLASGAVINFDNGNLTLTHSAATLTFTGRLVGNGSGLTGVGQSTATALTISCKAAEDIDIGEVVYVSGATGNKPQVSLADNTHTDKHVFCGVAAETQTSGQTILVRVRGELTTLNTNSFEVADTLYLSTGGVMVNSAPTSGAIEIIGYVTVKSATVGKMVILHHSSHGIHVPSTDDIVIRMGDSSASNKVYFKDYANAEVGYIDSDGKADFTSLTLDTALLPAEGGTGVSNGANNTITFTGNYTLGLTLTANTSVTLPTTGTLAKDDQTFYIGTTQVAINRASAALTLAGITLTTPDIGVATATSVSTPSIISASNADITIQPNGTGDTIIYAPSDVVTTKTAIATLTIAEAGTVLVSCAAVPYTITLPTASGHTGLRYHFIKTDANYFLITLAANGAETFNYENSTGTPNTTYARLNTYCAEVTIVSNGTNWQVIDEAMGQVPMVYAYLAAKQENIPDTTYVRVELSAETYDIGSNFDISVWDSGTADTDTLNHLIASGGAFTAAMVGARVENTTDGDVFAYIIARTSATDITLSADIFPDGTDNYEIRHSKFVVPVSGKYLVTNYVTLFYTGLVANKVYSNCIYKNHSRIQYTSTHSALSSYLTTLLTTTFAFSKDDYIESYFVLDTGSSAIDITQGNNITFMQIRLISKD